MALYILILFIVVPLAEIFILIKLGGLIGTLPTIALVVVTAVIGTALLRRQGMKALANAQRSVGEGKVPVDSVIDGLCLLVSGAFLLTPGLITDTVGFLLLVPPLRRRLARWALRQAAKRGNIDFQIFTSETKTSRNPGSPGGRTGDNPTGQGPIIEGEFEHIEEPRSANDRSPGDNAKPGARSKQDRSPWRKG